MNMAPEVALRFVIAVFFLSQWYEHFHTDDGDPSPIRWFMLASALVAIFNGLTHGGGR